ncbi:hypothetical protein P7M41_25755 [Vibrio parahaemolyticus]|nr:hypothetical protein [Vibrio parahaemolyticus]
MADFLPDFDFVEEEFDFAEFDGRPYLFEPEYTDEELREIEERRRREREAQQVEDERGGMAAARLRSSGDWWCTCECCAPVPTEEECLCCKEWDRLQPYFQGLDVTEDETPPPGVVSSWALSRAREIYFGRALESRARW